jgi:CheY-like chemotaxis protein/two-component sensor histidine kinase
MLQTIQTCAARGAHLVKQILSFARGVQGEKASVAIGQMVSELASFIRNTFPPDIVLETNVEPDLPPVLADATQLHQILLNLSVNARDAMPRGGNLRMNARLLELTGRQSPMLAQPVSGCFVELTVSDSGSGIPQEILPKIFEPFFTTKETEKGTGLGLSTVVSIVKAHGGFIEVESESGKGTTFRIYFPAGERTMAVEEKSAAKAEQGGGEQLLVVDDENAILELSRTILTEFNYRVLSASDGVQALSLFIEHQATIDLVITDLMMPSMGGADLISAIRKIKPDVRVLAVSGLGEGQANGGSRGEDGFLSKPYTGATLLASVHEILSRT